MYGIPQHPIKHQSSSKGIAACHHTSSGCGIAAYVLDSDRRTLADTAPPSPCVVCDLRGVGWPLLPDGRLAAAVGLFVAENWRRMGLGGAPTAPFVRLPKQGLLAYACTYLDGDAGVRAVRKPLGKETPGRAKGVSTRLPLPLESRKLPTNRFRLAGGASILVSMRRLKRCRHCKSALGTCWRQARAALCWPLARGERTGPGAAGGSPGMSARHVAVAVSQDRAPQAGGRPPHWLTDAGL